MFTAGIDSMPLGGSAPMDRSEVQRFPGVVVPPDRLTRVSIVDERPLILDALAAMLGAAGRFSVTTTCATCDADPIRILQAAPDLIVLGVGEAREQALRLVGAMHRLASEVRIVMIAESQDADLIRCVLDQGVAALVLTEVTGQDLESTIDRVLRGQVTLPAGWQAILAGSDQDPIASLSGRQLEVLRMLADGCTYEEISARLIISVNTVKFHVRSIYLRLGVGNRMAAAKLLEARGIPTRFRGSTPTESGRR